MTDEGWDIIDVQHEHYRSTVNSYDEMEKIELKTCKVKINQITIFFCLVPNIDKKDKKNILKCVTPLIHNCNTCKSRFTDFSYLIGENGEFAAFNKEFVSEDIKKIQELRETSKLPPKISGYTMIIFDENFVKKYPPQDDKFHHLHFVFKEIELTPPEISNKLKPLLLHICSFENRFKRLVDDPDSIMIIKNVIQQLVRPDHWKSVVDWAIAFVTRANGKKWDHLKIHEKYDIMVFAMMTGRSNGSVHLDMQQAENLIDFMDKATNSAALCSLMDARSNPETYQCSSVAKALDIHKITSLCTATLIWEGESDLDVHVITERGDEVYYGNKQIPSCSLDFDANADSNKLELYPAENISIKEVGSYTIKVNNFNNRNNENVKFQIIVRKSGVTVDTFTEVWPRYRRKDDKMEICTIVITPEDLIEKPVELSEVQRRKLTAKEEDWTRLFGNVKSFIVSVEQVEVLKVTSSQMSTNRDVEYIYDAQETFARLLAPPKQKKTLAERCQLENLESFIKHVTSNRCILQINPRHYVPAYVTRIETNEQVMKFKHVVNVYQRKNELPQAMYTDQQSSARFDNEWCSSSKINVYGFVKFGETWFMVLNDVHLPSRNSESWPVGGGFYATHLNIQGHEHRSKWRCYHSLMYPECPEHEKPLIGTLLTGFSCFTFFHDNCEITVHA
jgi:hypothetical protein